MRSSSNLFRAVFLMLAALAAGSAFAAGVPPLVAAVQAGDHDKALALLDTKSPDVSAAEPDGSTALHWAVRNDDLELAKRLLKAGADPKLRTRFGVTPLHLAALNGSPKMLELLLDAGADPNETGNEGETVLMTASRTGNPDAVQLLLDRGADVHAREKWHGQTPLMWAAAQCHPDVVRELVEHGADVNARSNEEQWQRQYTAEPRAKWLPPGAMTSLLFAARQGCLGSVQALIKLGADVNMTTPDGISPVLSALINGHYDVAAALIGAGANTNIVDDTGRGALYAAIDFNTMPASNRPAPYVLDNTHTALDVARLLLEHGANVNARLKTLPPYRAKLDRGNDTMLTTGTTAMLRAAKAGDIAAMRLLLEHGADPRLATKQGINPLMAAAGLGTTEQDTTGRYKTQAEAIAAIKLLLARGLDVNAADKRGRTALHGAALQGYDDVVRFLAAHGARLDVKDKQGFTPLDTALGLAGGFGFAGKDSVVHKSTAALLQQLMSARQQQSGATEESARSAAAGSAGNAGKG
ncbi:MAG TPA: ankyrin repeat domain-containing protein [Gammaproteobacteria bacterium]|nr:ankyrin repeat domain-containing protein [Gammaproteobacteria bacterium]